MAKKGVKKSIRGRAVQVLTPGTAAVTRKAFGTKKLKLKKSKKTNGRSRVAKLVRCLDAKTPDHLGLPRPVGPYTVVRTTKLFSSRKRFFLFAPFMHPGIAGGALGATPRWYSVCGIGPADQPSGDSDPMIHSSVDGTGNLKYQVITSPGQVTSAAECVPSALTVVVMNQNALQTTRGVIAMGRVNQQLNLSNSSDTYETIGQRFVSFYSPRLLTAPKLALQGVKCSAYPLDMNEYAEFMPIEDPGSGATTWGSTTLPAALSPIVVYQPAPNGVAWDTGDEGNGVQLTYLVTVEWRVRFDPLNPATSSHAMHPPTSDSDMASLLGAMSSMGHGVEDVAVGAANLGFDALRDLATSS
jgi:hypothetical protein